MFDIIFKFFTKLYNFKLLIVLYSFKLFFKKFVINILL